MDFVLHTRPIMYNNLRDIVVGMIDMHHWGMYIAQILYCIITSIIFHMVNNLTDMVVDEEFHLPQGLKYCRRDFLEWDPKITTFPGLYIMSTILFGPFELCTVYTMRLTNLVASWANFLLFYLIIVKRNPGLFHWKNLMAALNLAILPPLYFFTNLYYTDVLSVTFILLMMICFLEEEHSSVAFFGVCATLMRQTNILYVGMFGGIYAVREFVYAIKIDLKLCSGDNNLIVRRNVTWKDVEDLYSNAKIRIKMLNLMPREFWHNVIKYASVLGAFVIFVIINRGIVLGDKSAHQPSIHIPQIFYFSLFFIVFSVGMILEFIERFLYFLKHNRKTFILFCIIASVMIFCFTHEHPYLLADNRHFTFYIWQRFFQRYAAFRYMIIPVYYFGFYVMVKRLIITGDLNYITFYTLATFAMLCFQKMIEVRYFITPYLLARLYMRPPYKWGLILEFVTFLFINIASLYLFFTKEIQWENYTEPQRIMW